jgi:hypothetical protein
MKFLVLMGGFTGFASGLALGWANGGEGASVIWRACVAAYLAGLMMRWWGSLWLKGLQESHRERIAAAEAAEESTKAKP